MKVTYMYEILIEIIGMIFMIFIGGGGGEEEKNMRPQSQGTQNTFFLKIKIMTLNNGIDY